MPATRVGWAGDFAHPLRHRISRIMTLPAISTAPYICVWTRTPCTHPAGLTQDRPAKVVTLNFDDAGHITGITVT
jgi:hypothetical protein